MLNICLHQHVVDDFKVDMRNRHFRTLVLDVLLFTGS